MAKKDRRFIELYTEDGIVTMTKILVDKETGVNYLMGSHNKANGTGLTVLVDPEGRPIVTPIK